MSAHPCELFTGSRDTVPFNLLDREPSTSSFPCDARLLEPGSPGGGTLLERREIKGHLVNRSATKKGGAVHMLPPVSLPTPACSTILDSLCTS